MTYSETRFVTDAPRWVGEWAGPALLAGAVAVVIGVGVFLPPAPPVLTSAHVMIERDLGHGSATHIGDGLYVTAAHVVADKATVRINGQDSAVLWANSTYDIALVAGPETAASVPLWCGTASVGEVGLSHGYPMDLGDVSTSLTVSGEVRELGRWKVALPMDGAVGPGMSGGGWVVGGALAGVNVGAAMAPTTIGAPSYFGVSIVVPSSVVCELLGRS